MEGDGVGLGREQAGFDVIGMGLVCEAKDDSGILASANGRIVVLSTLGYGKLKEVQVRNEGTSRALENLNLSCSLDIQGKIYQPRQPGVQERV